MEEPEKSDTGTGPVKKLPEATEKSNTTERSDKTGSEHLAEEFKRYLLENNRRPSSVFHFSRHANISENEFYDYFNSLEALENTLWKGYFEETLERLQADETYGSYGAREKLLAFYFTWIEVLKNDRSYVVHAMKMGLFPKFTPSFMKDVKPLYISYVNTLISEGKENREIAKRYFISDRYGEGLWLQLLFVLNFWVRDKSARFEDTDAAIEKAVNLSFDLMGKTPLDSVVDLAKFLYNKW